MARSLMKDRQIEGHIPRKSEKRIVPFPNVGDSKSKNNKNSFLKNNTVSANTLLPK